MDGLAPRLIWNWYRRSLPRRAPAEDADIHPNDEERLSVRWAEQPG